MNNDVLEDLIQKKLKNGAPTVSAAPTYNYLPDFRTLIVQAPATGNLAKLVAETREQMRKEEEVNRWSVTPATAFDSADQWLTSVASTQPFIAEGEVRVDIVDIPEAETTVEAAKNDQKSERAAERPPSRGRSTESRRPGNTPPPQIEARSRCEAPRFS